MSPRYALFLAGPALIAITGCEDPVVVARADLGAVETTMSCTHTSYCMTCLPGFDGKLKCGPKLSPHCPGHRTASGHLIEETLRYPSKPDEEFTRRHFEGLTATGDCS
jgi:hypothetical protein